MKFRIRKGFVAHIPAVKDEDGNEAKGAYTASGGQDVELTEAEAAEHAHKLEPTDKAGAEFLAQRHVKVTPPAQGVSAAELSKLVAAAVSAELARRDADAKAAK